MPKSIENNIVRISVGSAITVLLFVIGCVWWFSAYSKGYDDKIDNVEKENVMLKTEIILLKSKMSTQESYNYNTRKELKDELKSQSKKLDDIVSILLKKEY